MKGRCETREARPCVFSRARQLKADGAGLRIACAHLHLVLLLAGRIEDADLRQAYVARQARPAERVARPVLEGDRGVAATEASLT